MLARPAMHARFGHVHACAFEPGRPLDPARLVADARPVGGKGDPKVVTYGSPEAVGLADRDAVQVVVARAAERSRQSLDVCRLELCSSRDPRVLIPRGPVSV